MVIIELDIGGDGIVQCALVRHHHVERVDQFKLR